MCAWDLPRSAKAQTVTRKTGGSIARLHDTAVTYLLERATQKRSRKPNVKDARR